MRKTLRSLLVFAMILSMVFVMTGCSGKDDQQLVLYTWEGMFPQEVLDGFTKETGIKIVYSNFDTNETMYEKLSMAKGGDYDLIIADDYMIEAITKANLAQPLNKDVIKNFSNINPLYQGQPFDPDDKYTVPYGAGIPLIVYDPAQVNFEIKGYNDLWDERLKNNVALIANYRVINGITLLSMGHSMNEEDPEIIKAAGEKLLTLAPSIRLIQDDNTQNSLLSGEASVAFLYTSQVTTALNENPNLKVVYPEEGLGFGIMGAFIPSNAPNAEAANLFLNYILKPDVFASCMNYIGYFNTSSASDALVNPSLVAPKDASKGEIIITVSAAADELFNKNWIEFKSACGAQ